MTDTVYVLNGPNLNLLGVREPDIYGSDTLDSIAGVLAERASGYELEIEFRQTNHEGTLVDWLHEAMAARAKAVLLNAGAYTHTSIALLDAIRSITVPVIEVHLSDPKTRESFRHHSFVGMGAALTFEGHGTISYLMALDAVAEGKVDPTAEEAEDDALFKKHLADDHFCPKTEPGAQPDENLGKSEDTARKDDESAPVRRV